MNFEKYASEAVALYKAAGAWDDLVPQYYKDKSLKQQFVPTMSQDDINSELSYLNSDQGVEDYKRMHAAQLKTAPALYGLASGLGTYAGLSLGNGNFSTKGKLQIAAAGALAGAVGGTLGTYTGQKLFGTSPERRIAMLNKYKE